VVGDRGEGPQEACLSARIRTLKNLPEILRNEK
jgi:hypothetical protein